LRPGGDGVGRVETVHRRRDEQSGAGIRSHPRDSYRDDDRIAYSDTDSNSHCYEDSHSDGDQDCDANPYGDANANADPDCDSDARAGGNAEVESESG
jgi:hypothetical protein